MLKVGAASLTPPHRGPEPSLFLWLFSPGAGQRPTGGSLAQVCPGLGRPGMEQAGTWAAAGWTLSKLAAPCVLIPQALHHHPSPISQKLLDTPVGCPKKLCEDLQEACETDLMEITHSTYPLLSAYYLMSTALYFLIKAQI